MEFSLQVASVRGQIDGPDSKPYFRPYLVRMDSMGNHIKTGIEEDAQIGLSPAVHIYPNPVNAILNIQSPQPYSIIELWNTSGKLILRETNTSDAIGVSAIPTGFYILRILGAQQAVISTQKVSVLH